MKEHYCKHCGKEIYYTENGWIPGGAWRHYHSDKEHCSYPVQEFAEPEEVKVTEGGD